jgi:hypothetical protein
MGPHQKKHREDIDRIWDLLEKEQAKAISKNVGYTYSEIRERVSVGETKLRRLIQRWAKSGLIRCTREPRESIFGVVCQTPVYVFVGKKK